MSLYYNAPVLYTAQKTPKFSIKNSFSKCDQIRRKLRICSHLLKKFLMGNFMAFLATYCVRYPYAVPFLRNKILYSVKNFKTTCRLGGRGWSIPNALDLSFYWTFLLFFLDAARMSLFSRISPDTILTMLSPFPMDILA